MGHVSITDKMYNTQLAEKLTIIKTDGTLSVTGYKSDFIASLEKSLDRHLQWVVCLWHSNELPLCHIFQMLDGTTTGPESFSRPTGKSTVGKVSDWQVPSFQKTENDEFPKLPNNVAETLSTDQYHAYKNAKQLFQEK